MQVWRVNTRTQEWRREPVPPGWERLGGRGLIARILLDRMNPLAHPLGPGNLLILAPGLLVGHRLSSCDRISFGGKSPLTGGVKEANAGGRTGWALTALGIKALILEDQPTADDWWVVHIARQGVRFDPAQDLVGLEVQPAAEKLMARYGEHIALAVIGPAGERLWPTAGIQNLDKDGVASRIAARGGLGAVMGSKRVKAMVIDPEGGQMPPLADPAGFRQARKAYTQALMAHPQTQIYADYGTAAMVALCNRLGGMPTRNFSAGSFEAAEAISGERLRTLLLARPNAQTTHACMAGCAIRCSNVVTDPNGYFLVSPLEYETIAMMGSNLGLDDLDTIARLNMVANQLGVDTIELGVTLGVAAEGGLWAFGDGIAAQHLLEEMRRGTLTGRLLGQGAVTVGRVLGVHRVPAVKGQGMPAYDPRAIKGTGVTYATSPQGADHTAGNTIRVQVDHLDPQGQARLSLKAQIAMAAYDTLGVCIFAGFGFRQVPETIPALLRARYGWEVPEDVFQRLGRETLRLERTFNRAAGFTSAHDRLPEWMTQEPLPPRGSVFDVPEADLDALTREMEEGAT